jgi:hypothetical protein
MNKKIAMLMVVAVSVGIVVMADSKWSAYKEVTSLRTNDFFSVAQPDLSTNAKIAMLNMPFDTNGAAAAAQAASLALHGTADSATTAITATNPAAGGNIPGLSLANVFTANTNRLGTNVSADYFWGDASHMTGITESEIISLPGDIANKVSTNDTRPLNLNNAANAFVGALAGNASTATTATASTFATNIVPIVQALAIVSTGGSNIVTMDFSLGNKYSLTLTTNIYMMQPSNLQAMKDAMIDVRQDVTGTRTVTWNTNYWKFPSAQILTFTTNASSWSEVSCVVGQWATNVAVVQTLNFQ